MAKKINFVFSVEDRGLGKILRITDNFGGRISEDDFDPDIISHARARIGKFQYVDKEGNRQVYVKDGELSQFGPGAAEKLGVSVTYTTFTLSNPLSPENH